MPRARNIKPGFFSNEALAECSPWARLCFIGLWTLADREGRLEDRPKRIKGELFRFDAVEVEPLLVELAAGGFIVRYFDGNGIRAIQVVEFVKHQHPHYSEKQSVIMPCDFSEIPPHIDPPNSENIPGADAETPGVDPSSRGGRNALNPESRILNPESRILNPESRILIPEEDEDSRLAQSASPTPPPPVPDFTGANPEALNGKALAKLSDDFEIPEKWGIDAEALGFKRSEVLRESVKFRAYFTRGRGAGTRRTVKGWSQSWSNWLDKAAKDR